MSVSHFELVEGQEATKAADFLKFVDNKFEGFRSENNIGKAAYGVLDALFEELTSERDFGYIVGFSNEDTPLIDDVNFGFTYEMYNLLVSNHTHHEYEDVGNMTVTEAGEQFWSMLAKFMLSNMPRDFDTAKEFVKLKVASIFNGFNEHGLRYHLWYVEFDDDKKVFTRTSELGDNLLVGNPDLALNLKF